MFATSRKSDTSPATGPLGRTTGAPGRTPVNPGWHSLATVAAPAPKSPTHGPHPARPETTEPGLVDMTLGALGDGTVALASFVLPLLPPKIARVVDAAVALEALYPHISETLAKANQWASTQLARAPALLDGLVRALAPAWFADTVWPILQDVGSSLGETLPKIIFGLIRDFLTPAWGIFSEDVPALWKGMARARAGALALNPMELGLGLSDIELAVLAAAGRIEWSLGCWLIVIGALSGALGAGIGGGAAATASAGTATPVGATAAGTATTITIGGVTYTIGEVTGIVLATNALITDQKRFALLLTAFLDGGQPPKEKDRLLDDLVKTGFRGVITFLMLGVAFAAPRIGKAATETARVVIAPSTLNNLAVEAAKWTMAKYGVVSANSRAILALLCHELAKGFDIFDLGILAPILKLVGIDLDNARQMLHLSIDISRLMVTLSANLIKINAVKNVGGFSSGPITITGFKLGLTSKTMYLDFSAITVHNAVFNKTQNGAPTGQQITCGTLVIPLHITASDFGSSALFDLYLTGATIKDLKYPGLPPTDVNLDNISIDLLYLDNIIEAVTDRINSRLTTPPGGAVSSSTLTPVPDLGFPADSHIFVTFDGLDASSDVESSGSSLAAEGYFEYFSAAVRSPTRELASVTIRGFRGKATGTSEMDWLAEREWQGEWQGEGQIDSFEVHGASTVVEALLAADVVKSKVARALEVLEAAGIHPTAGLDIHAENIGGSYNEPDSDANPAAGEAGYVDVALTVPDIGSLELTLEGLSAGYDKSEGALGARFDRLVATLWNTSRAELAYLEIVGANTHVDTGANDVSLGGFTQASFTARGDLSNLIKAFQDQLPSLPKAAYSIATAVMKLGLKGTVSGTALVDVTKGDGFYIGGDLHIELNADTIGSKVVINLRDLNAVSASTTGSARFKRIEMTLLRKGHEVAFFAAEGNHMGASSEGKNLSFRAKKIEARGDAREIECLISAVHKNLKVLPKNIQLAFATIRELNIDGTGAIRLDDPNISRVNGKTRAKGDLTAGFAIPGVGTIHIQIGGFIGSFGTTVTDVHFDTFNASLKNNLGDTELAKLCMIRPGDSDERLADTDPESMSVTMAGDAKNRDALFDFIADHIHAPSPQIAGAMMLVHQALKGRTDLSINLATTNIGNSSIISDKLSLTGDLDLLAEDGTRYKAPWASVEVTSARATFDATGNPLSIRAASLCADAHVYYDPNIDSVQSESASHKPLGRFKDGGSRAKLGTATGRAHIETGEVLIDNLNGKYEASVLDLKADGDLKWNREGKAPPQRQDQRMSDAETLDAAELIKSVDIQSAHIQAQAPMTPGRFGSQWLHFDVGPGTILHVDVNVENNKLLYTKVWLSPRIKFDSFRVPEFSIQAEDDRMVFHSDEGPVWHWLIRPVAWYTSKKLVNVRPRHLPLDIKSLMQIALHPSDSGHKDASPHESDASPHEPGLGDIVDSVRFAEASGEASLTLRAIEDTMIGGIMVTKENDLYLRGAAKSGEAAIFLSASSDKLEADINGNLITATGLTAGDLSMTRNLDHVTFTGLEIKRLDLNGGVKSDAPTKKP